MGGNIGHLGSLLLNKKLSHMLVPPVYYAGLWAEPRKAPEINAHRGRKYKSGLGQTEKSGSFEDTYDWSKR